MSEETIKSQAPQAITEESIPVKRKRGRPKWSCTVHSLDLQARFVAYYLTTFSCSRSAEMCGIKKFSNRRGYELYHHPAVEKAIRKGLRTLQKKCLVKGSEVVMRLRRNEEEAYSAGRLRESTRCLELLGKVAALFTEKVQIDQKVPLGPRLVVLNMPDGTVVEQKQEVLNGDRFRLGKN